MGRNHIEHWCVEGSRVRPRGLTWHDVRALHTVTQMSRVLPLPHKKKIVLCHSWVATTGRQLLRGPWPKPTRHSLHGAIDGTHHSVWRPSTQDCRQPGHPRASCCRGTTRPHKNLTWCVAWVCEESKGRSKCGDWPSSLARCTSVQVYVAVEWGRTSPFPRMQHTHAPDGERAHQTQPMLELATLCKFSKAQCGFFFSQTEKNSPFLSTILVMMQSLLRAVPRVRSLGVLLLC
jgi:hypothetical protein